MQHEEERKSLKAEGKGKKITTQPYKTVKEQNNIMRNERKSVKRKRRGMTKMRTHRRVGRIKDERG